jgi:hypothetical protein
LERDLRESRPSCIAIASAYISAWGVDRLRAILRRSGNPECRLIAGVDQAVTHPEALYIAVNIGWKLRLGDGGLGIFHPKIVLAGRRFDAHARVLDPSLLWVGSANLTYGGFDHNTECVFTSVGGSIISGAVEAFAAFWNGAKPATSQALRDYAALFAERNRSRSPEELDALDVSDGRKSTGVSLERLRVHERPTARAVSQSYGALAWAGLQSFTGEYRFQLEFPRAAGEVVRGLIGVTKAGPVDVLCADDQVRSMKFDFYEHNQMFRLNIPNEVPGVDWAREHKDGIGVVQRGPQGGAPLRLELLRPGPRADEIVAKSYALGCWGKTSTRLYGWM